jgi:regulator of protease activity HflC (stomatin/prohibitin superfamily)
MKAKRVAKILFVFFLAFFLTGCVGCTRIEPGHVGIKVNMLGSDRGVSNLTMETGLVLYMPFMTRVFEYPTSVQVATWIVSERDGRKGHNDEITFNTKEGLVFQVDISFAYQLVKEKIPQFYVKFRNDDLQEFTHVYLRNIARDAFQEVGALYTAEEIYGVKKEELLKNVVLKINKSVEEYLKIEQFGFLGDIRMPTTVRQAIEGKIRATQIAIQTENEIRAEKASAQKAIAKAEGEAKSNYIVAQSITPNLLEWRRLQIAEWTVGKWDGHRPYFEGGGNANLMFAMPQHQSK